MTFRVVVLAKMHERDEIVDRTPETIFNES